jgi:predicted dinucleotide-binding enzyme
MIIQAAAPYAKVVEAFNTHNWTTMANPASAGGLVSVPLAGDNLLAKRKVADLVSGMDLEPIDVGPVEYGRWVEVMLILWINNRHGSLRPSFDYHLRCD